MKTVLLLPLAVLLLALPRPSAAQAPQASVPTSQGPVYLVVQKTPLNPLSDDLKLGRVVGWDNGRPRTRGLNYLVSATMAHDAYQIGDVIAWTPQGSTLVQAAGQDRPGSDSFYSSGQDQPGDGQQLASSDDGSGGEPAGGNRSGGGGASSPPAPPADGGGSGTPPDGNGGSGQGSPPLPPPAAGSGTQGDQSASPRPDPFLYEHAQEIYERLKPIIEERIRTDVPQVLAKGWANALSENDFYHGHVLLKRTFPADVQTDAQKMDYLATKGWAILYHTQEKTGVIENRNIVSRPDAGLEVKNGKKTFYPADLGMTQLIQVDFTPNDPTATVPPGGAAALSFDWITKYLLGKYPWAG